MIDKIEGEYNLAFERGMRYAVACLEDSMDEIEERMRKAPIDYTSRMDEFGYVMNDILGLRDAQKLGSKGGKASAAKLTPLQRKQRATKASHSRRNK